jgi:hypothetical protein
MPVSIGYGLSIDMARAAGAGGGAGYTAQAVYFDGSIQLNRTSLVATNSPFFSLSYWVLFNSGISTGQHGFIVDMVGGNAVPYFSGQRRGGTFYTDMVWSAYDYVGEMSSFDADTVVNANPSGPIVSGVWHHVLASFDTGHGDDLKLAKIYIDNIDVTHIKDDQDIAFPMLFNTLSFRFYGSDLSFADVWCAPGQSLLTAGDIPQATRRKFRDASGKPVDLGATGSTPTGTAPAIFFSGNASTFATNKGTGGAFTLTGALTNAPTSPSDGGGAGLFSLLDESGNQLFDENDDPLLEEA